MNFEVQGVTKSFDDSTAIEGANLEINEGEVTAIVGPSGSGKTTFLRLLNLLEEPTKGSVLIDGCDPWERSLKERKKFGKRMTMVFQNPVLFQRSVQANVMYPLLVRGGEKERSRELARTTLNDVGLGEKLDQFAPTLSAGEGQRMAFARATVLKPHALLLDEFTANLDPANVSLLERAVHRFNRDTGSTIILATHNLFQAKRISHRTAIMFNGRFIESGPTVEVFSKPKKKLTKSFISGEMPW